MDTEAQVWNTGTQLCMVTHVSQRRTVTIRSVLLTIESRKVWTWCGRTAWVMARVFIW